MAVALAACSAGSGDPVTDARAAIADQDYRSARIHLMTALQDNARDPEANLLFAKTMIELGDPLGAEAALDKLAGQATFADRAAPLLGRVYLMKGQNDEALKLADEPAGSFAADLHAIKALALIGKGQGEKADSALNTGLAAFPNNAELQWIKGNELLARGAIDEASLRAKRALAKRPEALEALLLSARLSLAKADGEKALNYLEKIQKVRPDNVAARILAGIVLKDLGKAQEAMQHFRDVLSVSANHPMATYYAAQIEFDEGKSDKAYERFQSTKAELEKIAPALRLSGILELRRGNYEKAIDRLNRYLASNVADTEATVALAEALSGAGNEQDAFDTISPIAGEISAPSGVLKLATSLARKAGNDQKADDFAARAATLEEDPVTNHIFRAEQAALGQRWNRAEAIYTKLLDSDLGDREVMILNNAATARLKLARATGALAFARRAHALKPDDPVVQDTLGWILLQTRTDKVQALELIRSASARIPQDPEIRWHLASALMANGQSDEAKAVMTELKTLAGAEQIAEIDLLLARL